MMDEQGAGPSGVPVWIVTFGDMMALLLTFFIMLASFSELKSEEKYQALLDSFQQQFGFHRSNASLLPGDFRPRHSGLAKLAGLGRLQRMGALQQTDRMGIPAVSHQLSPSVQRVSPTAVGTVLYFQQEQVELDAAQRDQLLQYAAEVRGKSQRVEIRSYVAARPLTASGSVRESWDRAYERSQRIMEFLVAEGQVAPQRIRVVAAAAPAPQSGDATEPAAQWSAGVEIFLLDEVPNETAAVARLPD